MYGVIPVTPDHAEADLAVLFIHNEGYSTMCGHAVIALGRWAVDQRLVRVVEPETLVRIQCPCGLVRAKVEVANGRAGAVRFESVPAFAFALEQAVEVPGFGRLRLDIGYGGAFYAILPAAQVGLDIRTASVRDLTDAGDRITQAVKAQLPLEHPDDPDLAFLYGTILTDGGDGSQAPSANVCIFAAREVDRSPTGSGVTARIALQHAKAELELGVERRFESVTGAVFTGKAVQETRVGQFKALTVEVGGKAYYTGRATFTVERDDPLGSGFLLR
jgi:trans-L-3-hydroxyproline dehydratase